MLAVLSPAKSLDFKKDLRDHINSLPLYTEQSEQIIKKLKTISRKKLSELMKISYPLAEMNWERYQTWDKDHHEKNSRPAAMAFTGDAYRGFDAWTLNKKLQARAQKHIRIFSGLYGVIKPLDLIQAYRLEMGTKLPVKRKKNLYEIWKPSITEHIQNCLSENKSDALINLASVEYFKALDKKAIDLPIIQPVFYDAKGGQYKVIQFYAKRARGLMARYIVDHNPKKAEDLKAFDYEGYQYNPKLSDGNKWVFSRNQVPVTNP